MTVCVFMCSPAFGQEAGSVTNCPELSIIPRVDATPFSPVIYTLLDGSIGEHLSYSFSNLWVSEDTPSLYHNSMRSDEADWCQWAYLSLDLGSWHIAGGKQIVAIGSFETDEYDFDQYWQMCTNTWNNFLVYQYGASVQYDTPSENTSFMLQMTSSPVDEHPFESGAKIWTFKWTGEYGCYSSLWSASMMDYRTDVPKSDGRMYLFVSGNKFDVTDNVSLGLDWYFHIGGPGLNVPGSTGGDKLHDNLANSLALSAKWQPLDWMDVSLRGIYENSNGMGEDFFGVPENYFNGGILFQFYPISSLEGLRLHALAGKNNLDGWYASAGITYNFNLTQTLLNRRSK